MIGSNPSFNFNLSKSPHSVGLQNSVTIPTPWADSNYFVKTEKSFLAQGLQGKNGGGCGCGGCNHCSGGMAGMTGLGDLSSIMDSLSSLTFWDWVAIIGVSYFALMLFEGKPSRYGR